MGYHDEIPKTEWFICNKRIPYSLKTESLGLGCLHSWFLLRACSLIHILLFCCTLCGRRRQGAFSQGHRPHDPSLPNPFISKCCFIGGEDFNNLVESKYPMP